MNISISEADLAVLRKLPDELYEKFLNMYKHCLAKHSNTHGVYKIVFGTKGARLYARIKSERMSLQSLFVYWKDIFGSANIMKGSGHEEFYVFHEAISLEKLLTEFDIVDNKGEEVCTYSLAYYVDTPNIHKKRDIAVLQSAHNTIVISHVGSHTYRAKIPQVATSLIVNVLGEVFDNIKRIPLLMKLRGSESKDVFSTDFDIGDICMTVKCKVVSRNDVAWRILDQQHFGFVRQLPSDIYCATHLIIFKTK